jgi:hypothetical protein
MFNSRYHTHKNSENFRIERRRPLRKVITAKQTLTTYYRTFTSQLFLQLSCGALTWLLVPYTMCSTPYIIVPHSAAREYTSTVPFWVKQGSLHCTKTDSNNINCQGHCPVESACLLPSNPCLTEAFVNDGGKKHWTASLRWPSLLH